MGGCGVLVVVLSMLAGIPTALFSCSVACLLYSALANCDRNCVPERGAGVVLGNRSSILNLQNNNIIINTS